jgi:UDP-glucuronate 4-epimerase
MLAGHKILMTGLTGQIGSSIADRIAGPNELWGFARFSEPGSRERLEALGVTCVVGDCATGDFTGLPDDFDYVIHLAATTRPANADVGMTQNAEGTGLLMHHCRKSKAFLHCSAGGIYSDHFGDPSRKITEADELGGTTPFSPNYGPSKTAAEGVARTLCRLYDLPTVIARMDVSYGGRHSHGGLPGMQLEQLVARQPIRLPKSHKIYLSPIHDDDIAGQLEPLLKAASVPAFVVNWGGAEGVSVEEWVRYMGEITGIEPIFDFTDDLSLPHHILDTTRGRSIGMEWKIPWREGMRRMIQERHPEIQLREPASA